MKRTAKTLPVNTLVEALREARKRLEIHYMPQHSPDARSGSIFALNLIVSLFMDRLDISSSGPEANRFRARIHGTGSSKEDKQVKQESEDYIAGLRRLAGMNCRCDGGFLDCSACVAERKIKQLRAVGVHIPVV